MRELDESLGGNLLIAHGDPAQILPRVAAAAGAKHVHAAAAHTPYAMARDDRVAIRREPPRRPVIIAPSRPPVYVVRPPAYRYQSPRWSRPYYRGGLAYFYYGGFGWYPRATYFADRGYFGRGYASDLGELRLRVSPRWADVYVDGFYAGTVDQFDGVFQSLKLESGPYLIEIVAPGYEPLEVNVRISPGEKVTYRGDLRREP